MRPEKLITIWIYQNWTVLSKKIPELLLKIGKKPAALDRIEISWKIATYFRIGSIYYKFSACLARNHWGSKCLMSDFPQISSRSRIPRVRLPFGKTTNHLRPLLKSVAESPLSHDQCQNHWRKLVLGLARMPNTQQPYPIGQGMKVRTHTCWEIAQSPCIDNCCGSMNHSTCSLVVLEPWLLPCWELCDFSMGMASCYLSHDEWVFMQNRKFEESSKFPMSLELVELA